jgi:hypothetical protein
MAKYQICPAYQGLPGKNQARSGLLITNAAYTNAATVRMFCVGST